MIYASHDSHGGRVRQCIRCHYVARAEFVSPREPKNASVCPDPFERLALPDAVAHLIVRGQRSRPPSTHMRILSLVTFHLKSGFVN